MIDASHLATRPDGSQVILNPDGSVYLSLPPAVQSTGGAEVLWRVKQVTTQRQVGLHPYRVYVTTSYESLNSLLRLTALHHAAGVRSVRVGDSFRWGWEYDRRGQRLTNVIWATPLR